MSEAATTAVETRPPVGSHTGQVTVQRFHWIWFYHRYGDEPDVFVHQTNINPTRSTYRTLVKDEYVSLDLSTTKL